jgi:spore germination protein KB
MRKEQISDKEAICLLIIFILGSTAIVGIGGEAKNDAWIAGIAGMLMAVPIVFIYARIQLLFPGKDLYEILYLIAGKVFSKILTIVYIWYAFHLGALVIRNFGEFINTATMPETPIIVPMLCLGLVGVIAAKSGIEVMGRISAYSLPALLFIVVLVQLLGIPQWEFHNIKPVLGRGLAPVLKGGFAAFSFPFAETVIFLGVFFSLKNPRSVYKTYFTGLFSSGIVITILATRNILILGGASGLFYFPSHVAVSRIRIGDFIERIEVTVALVFVFGVFIKSAVCLFVVCKGIAKMLKLKDYRAIVIQTGALMCYFSFILYDNIMEMQEFAFKVYAYYAFPFQVIIPALLLIIAEIKMRRSRNREDSGAT